jgi:hypothetical protein
MAHGALTPIIGLRLLALAAGLRHNAEIGQPGLCFSAYGHKFGINHLPPSYRAFLLFSNGAHASALGAERIHAGRAERHGLLPVEEVFYAVDADAETVELWIGLEREEEELDGAPAP